MSYRNGLAGCLGGIYFDDEDWLKPWPVTVSSVEVTWGIFVDSIVANGFTHGGEGAVLTYLNCKTENTS